MHSRSPSCGMAVMAKASQPGLSKTRLCPPLTFDEAARLNTAFLQDVAANIRTAAASIPIAEYMAFGPPGSEHFFRSTLPRGTGLMESWFPHFGDCLFSAITQQFDRGHAAAVVLNSDSPTLPTALLIETAQVLARPGDRAVLGPSTDGGYYLLGLKRAHRRMFEDIDWSTEKVARQTLERAREIGLSVHMLHAWYDVDDAEALQTAYAELIKDVAFAPDLERYPAANTAALLRSLIEGSDLMQRLHTARACVVERAAE
jgi:uncharacterized protein